MQGKSSHGNIPYNTFQHDRQTELPVQPVKESFLSLCSSFAVPTIHYMYMDNGPSSRSLDILGAQQFRALPSSKFPKIVK